MNILYKKLIVVAIIGLLLGFISGTYITIKAVAKVGAGFLDPELIEQAIFQYKNRIQYCYPSVLNLST